MARIGDINSIINDGLKSFMEEYKRVYEDYKWEEPYSGFRLEQCGKQWRVMQYTLGHKEPKTDFMTYKEAEALMKIFKAGENDGDS